MVKINVDSQFLVNLAIVLAKEIDVKVHLPSDTLKIVDSKVSINNVRLEDKELYCYNYIDSTRNGIKLIKTFSNKEFENLGSGYKDVLYKGIKKKASKRSSLFPYPYAKEQNWTRDNYGELIIPKKGMTIILDKNNFRIYKKILLNFESENFEVLKNETKTYTFKNNYYFMMGDNRHGSRDSRSFGFVPEAYIQGKMIKVFSKERLFS